MIGDNNNENVEKQYDFQFKESQGKNGVISFDIKMNFDTQFKEIEDMDTRLTMTVNYYSKLMVLARQQLESDYREKGYKLATDVKIKGGDSE